MKMRHKKMARAAFRSQWHSRRFGKGFCTEWVGPFAHWHRQFRSVR